MFLQSCRVNNDDYYIVVSIRTELLLQKSNSTVLNELFICFTFLPYLNFHLFKPPNNHFYGHGVSLLPEPIFFF